MGGRGTARRAPYCRDCGDDRGMGPGLDAAAARGAGRCGEDRRGQGADPGDRCRRSGRCRAGDSRRCPQARGRSDRARPVRADRRAGDAAASCPQDGSECGGGRGRAAGVRRRRSQPDGVALASADRTVAVGTGRRRGRTPRPDPPALAPSGTHIRLGAARGCRTGRRRAKPNPGAGIGPVGLVAHCCGADRGDGGAMG